MPIKLISKNTYPLLIFLFFMESKAHFKTNKVFFYVKLKTEKKRKVQIFNHKNKADGST